MYEQLDLNRRKLIDIALQFKSKVLEGLRFDNRELKCIPCFVPYLKVPKSGKAYVLDLGGSNIRAAVISLKDGKIKFDRSPLKDEIPWKRNVIFSKREFLDIQSNLLNRVAQTEELPLGYCFSYPVKSTRDRDAVLIEWTKELLIPDTEGHKVGKMLLEHIQSGSKIKCSGVTVINDAVAALVSGLTKPKVDINISLIAASGTNLATFIETDFIPKLSGLNNSYFSLPVNFESANFSPPHLTHWDNKVDSCSENPGKQIFEKAASGIYLGRLFSAVCPDSNFDSETGSKGLVRILNEVKEEKNKHLIAARKIYERSARLAAASLAGLINLLVGFRPGKTIRIVAEGKLFWSKLAGEHHYLNITRSTLSELLTEFGFPDLSIEWVRIENANLIGSALAALSEE
jgi:hexokinase